MKKYLYAFIFIWFLALHFLAFDNPKVQKVISYFKPDAETKILASEIDDEYKLILDFINAYYPIDENSDPNIILSRVEKLVESTARDRILEGYKDNLNFLIERKAKRSYELEKILLHKQDEKYVVYLNMKKSLNGSKDFPYVFKVVFDLKKEATLSSHKSKVFNLTELILTDPKQGLLDKTLWVENDITTRTDFPCKTDALLALKNEDEIEYKVMPSGKTVSFNSSDAFKKEAEFKAVCGRRSFKIQLAKNDQYSTLYQRFENADSIYKPIELTKDEQLAKDIQEQFGGELIH